MDTWNGLEDSRTLNFLRCYTAANTEAGRVIQTGSTPLSILRARVPRSSIWWLFVAAFVLLAPDPSGSAATPAPAPGRRVLLISVDGLRPDLLLRANTPALHELMARGSFSMWARTTAVAVTLPSHTSMVTGCRPSRHEIEWNHDLPLAEPVYPSCPTLFDLAKAAGRTTAMAAGKSKFSALAKPGTLDWWFVPPVTVITDDMVTDTAVAMITKHRPEVLFVHLPEVDSIGHARGWGSAEQIQAI